MAKKSSLALFFTVLAVTPFSGHCLAVPPSTKTTPTERPSKIQEEKKYGASESFSVPLLTERPEPTNFFGTLNQLWNDPRPVNQLIGDAINGGGADTQDDDSVTTTIIPYCILSDEFVIQERHRFRILLYPRGRFAGSSASSSSAPIDSKRAGPAAAYLRYIPNEYGDEVDISWKLCLVDTRTNKDATTTTKATNDNANALPIMTSGGLPRSNTTWSAAMTFCSEWEDIESVGRVSDWGSSTWYAQSVCDALGHLEAQGEITVYDSRIGESSFSLPRPRGAFKAVLDSAVNAGETTSKKGPKERSFRVGEVIVPMDSNGNDDNMRKMLEDSFISPGIDYRIMTMADKDGTPIFSTDSVPIEERKDVRLAVRPCGWKLQTQLWSDRGMKAEWPVDVPAGWLSSSALSRFNLAAAFPRVASTFQRDKTAVILGILLALAPLPAALVGRNFVSFYAIPSASMDPTLTKGDLLVVEKFPGVFDRTQRGDVILFRPPSALRDIVGSSNRNAIPSNSLFVKRIVGMPGDRNILLEPETNEVLVDGQRAIGPDRNLCDDEPLRLIDRWLENGKGKKIGLLGEDEVYVLGDCKAVSVDSRVFGALPKSDIEGKPIGRIWPLSRFKIGSL